ncbi:class I SAM-dependent methyltransferase [Streptomyces sp. NBC_00859]|uniref:class I SAM-dependent methyltransferase n=1 Tax=Streptomyces sp. NBC_00859 TaxID=2903682 RepID=UPI00386F467D|nr:methyltransferase domain-containing protein [Streptomyces sp. NBC_00859]
MSTAFDVHERQLWAGRATAYGVSFAALCAHTVEDVLDAAGVGGVLGADATGGPEAGGPSVLDVGCGTGSVSSAAVARGARVTGVDADRTMVDTARARVPGAAFQEGALPLLPFSDGEFEAVVGNFVINHVGDPRAALNGMRRVVRPGGRVAVTIWGGSAAAGQALLWRAVEAAGVERPGGLPRLAAEAEFPRTEEGFGALLGAAGLRDVKCAPVVWDHLVDPDVWWAGAVAGVATIGHVLGGLTDGVRARVKREYDVLAREFTTASGELALPHTALLAAGSR